MQASLNVMLLMITLTISDCWIKPRDASDQVVGVYRIMTAQMATAAGRFYCAHEYDLTPLLQSGKRILELGRSCLHADYRGGSAMLHLWAALADYVLAREIDVLFGVASFHGTDVKCLAGPLSLLASSSFGAANRCG